MPYQDVAEKKPSQIATFITPIREYLRDTVSELRKVRWPSRLDTRNLTIIVMGVTFGMAAILGLFDFLFERLCFVLLKPQPEPVAIAVSLVVVISIIILVVFTSRQNRS